MFTFIVVIHVLACLALIAIILLQAGRGGGLSEAFGGGGVQSIFGTKTTTFLTKTTTIAAIIFLLTCLSLAILSGRRSRSLMEREAAKREIVEILDTKEEGEGEALEAEIEDLREEVEEADK